MPGSEPFTIPAAIGVAAQRFPDSTAVLDGPVRLDFAQLLERVRTVARALMAEGVRPGDRVALCSPNTHHWVLAALGAQYAGATLVPVNTRFTGAESLDVIRRSQARALVIAGEFLGTDRLAQIRAANGGPLDQLRTTIRIPVEGELEPVPGTRRWSDLDELATAVPPERADEVAAAVTPDDVSDILFTSGTTGRSKGAMSAHRQALGVARAWVEHGALTSDDRYLVINPFFHSFGYKAGILACLLSGAALLPQPTFDVAEVLRRVEADRITVLPGPPTIYQSMLDHADRGSRDLSSLRLAVTGAATVPVVLVERMQRELSFDTVLTAYGLTEAVVATMCRPEDDDETVARTCGRAAAGLEVRIAGSDGTAKPAGEAGEIQVRGDNVMLGYLDDEAATEQAIGPGGWLRTGDVGTLDERGYLTITDRLKDMYICGGFNVYPAEVEQVLARLDGVVEVAVVGVPDERLGEVGKAFVVGSAELSAEQVLAHCRDRLANYKRPRQVEFRTDLPRNPSGKILKRLLRDLR
ncbi:Acyl-CoA synthetase (AMP-forming)/AMP-acid ligase II [Saccharopolyspora kobensis]|uniref:Acyl-CoA synthetase (AMP-forming)/AMP-acid ligase II n=1 Tax=Saccharopolyspora kobensis TaxID=146035 RepID=A0A1H6ELM3_9PSEU|nr:FadD3 family acyl-CoA ligase [Saccharopolyspora kobensis]SEG98757.1 Acyl-CoA synthetase (AMP-forming)/AMP-acid ligase II [Saccharopolyspora kobensis]SFF28955.1 Acyl-CoA synthetase (AMP-forming)/AMP-acid ligase II [Saccharopolyspora kobensis]